MHLACFPTAKIWPPTRDEALRRMAVFASRAGRPYAAERNYDRGPQDRANVSMLSPYVRHRVITETELLETVLARHSLRSAEKFVQEVFWRTYWKGWLEAHPSVWSSYLEDVTEHIAALERDSARTDAYWAAVHGRTGIDAFDAWARELVERNYLHNHARMWFASIWIFTLQLPWVLGADFFMRHLVDGDPASNTLSWRWVAGLHTRGKTYVATRDNIRRYTADRFQLEQPLARSVSALTDSPVALARRIDVPLPALGDEPALLLLHGDDLLGDLRDVPLASVRGVCALRAAQRRSPQPLHPAVSAFSDAVAREAVGRAAARTSAVDLGVLEPTEPRALLDALGVAATICGATRIITPFAPVGPTRSVLADIHVGAGAAKLGYLEFGRRYDAVSWPSATSGFFNLRKRIPTILTELGIGSG